MHTVNDAFRALIFGSKRQYFALGNATIWGTQVTPDTQLAILGVFNKMMDYLVNNALEHLASQILTLWMTQEPGVHAIDFEMHKELVKPWIAIAYLVKRWRLFGWKASGWRAMIRFALTMASSISFLLLGAALNTIGMPKGRWYPDLFPKSKANDALMTLRTPRMSLTSLEWMDLWAVGQNIVGNGPQLWVSAVASASASMYSILGNLDGIYARNQEPGWCGFAEPGNSVTALNNTVSGSTVESISIQTSFISDIYNSLQDNGPMYAKASSGLMGTVGLTLPRLTTTCSQVNNSTALEPNAISVNILDNSTLNDTLKIAMGPNAAASFTGAECATSFRQAVIPVNSWYNGPSVSGLNLIGDGFGDTEWMPRSVTSLPLPLTQNDAENLRQLGLQFSSMLPSLDGLLTEASLVQHMALAAQKLRITQPLFETDTASLAAVVAIMMQHLITVAAWNMTASSTEFTTHYPLRWYVYGSGPRLSWEWAVGFVLCVFVLFLTYDVYLTLRYRTEPGRWLQVGGMMAAANVAERMKSLDRSIMGIAKEAGKTARYYVRCDGEGDVKLFDDAGQRELVKKMTVYGEGHLEYRLRSALDNLNACAQRRDRS